MTESWSNDVAFRFLSLDSVFLIGVYAENIDEADRVLRLCVESINARIIPVAREGELPNTLVDQDDWPIKVDYEDLLIIKELEIDVRASMKDITKKLGISLEKLKYHFREQVSKRGLIESY